MKPSIKSLLRALEKVAAKDPRRWEETVVFTPHAKLTKRELHDYYDTAKIRNRILDAVGKTETIIRQSFSPQHMVLRRKDGLGRFIRLTKDRYNEWNKRRMSEIHPTFASKVPAVVVDIDPQEKVPWKKTKTITETVAKTMEGHPDIRKVKVQFSGGRGFYVVGQLDQLTPVDQARKKGKDILQGIAARPDVTFDVAEPDQIRLDMTPLKRRGSVRAPFSLNATTGLVSAPVKIEDLPGLQKDDFTVDKILSGVVKKAARKEFAPGIPASKKVHKIPSKPGEWDMVVQVHDAKKAGKHWDLRLIEPGTNHAHSFAVPRARFPRKADRMLLAIQQPTHTADYARHFEGTIQAGTYGAGKVTRELQEKVRVIKSNDKRIQFERPGGKKYTLFRTQGVNWGIRRTS